MSKARDRAQWDLRLFLAELAGIAPASRREKVRDYLWVSTAPLHDLRPDSGISLKTKDVERAMYGLWRAALTQAEFRRTYLAADVENCGRLPEFVQNCWRCLGEFPDEIYGILRFLLDRECESLTLAILDERARVRVAQKTNDLATYHARLCEMAGVKV